MKKIYEKFLSLFKTQMVEDKPYYLSYENGGVLVLHNPVEHQEKILRVIFPQASQKNWRCVMAVISKNLLTIEERDELRKKVEEYF